MAAKAVRDRVSNLGYTAQRLRAAVGATGAPCPGRPRQYAPGDPAKGLNRSRSGLRGPGGRVDSRRVDHGRVDPGRVDPGRVDPGRVPAPAAKGAAAGCTTDQERTFRLPDRHWPIALRRPAKRHWIHGRTNGTKVGLKPGLGTMPSPDLSRDRVA